MTRQTLDRRSEQGHDMDRVAPKRPMLDHRMRVRSVPPEKLTERLTAIDDVLELSSMGIPDVSAHDWRLEVAGLVDRPAFFGFEEIRGLQKRTVEYVFRRLYLDKNPAYRFLVADEVGLGKTMVARGIIAKAIHHLQPDVPRIDNRLYAE